MTDFSSILSMKGDIQMVFQHKDGTRRVLDYEDTPNTVLRGGRLAVARMLANRLDGGSFYYITRMLWGDGGAVDGVKKYVDYTRNGLFGTTRLSKPVIATMDPTSPTTVTFTSVMTYDDIPHVMVNEMALQMSNGDLYSMSTFAGFTKLPEMEITFHWRCTFVG